MDNTYQSILDTARAKLLNVIQLTPENKYVLLENKDGYLVHTRDDADTGVKMARTQVTVPYSPMDIISVVADITQRPNYDKKFESGVVHKVIDERTRINHSKAKPPAMLVSPRDIVAIGQVTQLEDGTIIMVATSIEIPELPPQKGYERAQLHLVGWVLKPTANGGTEATTIACMDPKGNLSKIANSDKAGKGQVELVRNLMAYIGQKKK